MKALGIGNDFNTFPHLLYLSGDRELSHFPLKTKLRNQFTKYIFVTNI